jgi:hypothetical protein
MGSIYPPPHACAGKVVKENTRSKRAYTAIPLSIGPDYSPTGERQFHWGYFGYPLAEAEHLAELVGSALRHYKDPDKAFEAALERVRVQRQQWLADNGCGEDA